MTWIAVGVGVAGTQAVIGGAQYFANKKRIAKEEANRVKYKIPDEVYQNLNQSQQQALQGLPEEQKQQYLSNLQRSSSYALGQAGTRKAGLAGVSAINEQQNVGYGNMLAQDSAARMQNQDKLIGQRANVADYKNMAFSQEKNAQDVYNAKANANVGTLTQNLMGAAGSVAGIKIPKKEVKPPPPSSPNYVTPNDSYNRGYQVGTNANNYYNPASIQSQSGTIVPDNYNQYNNIG